MEKYVKNPKLEENKGLIGKKYTERYCRGFEFQAVTAYSPWVKALSLVRRCNVQIQKIVQCCFYVV